MKFVNSLNSLRCLLISISVVFANCGGGGFVDNRHPDNTQELYNAINNLRVEAGLEPLIIDENLCKTAEQRAGESLKKRKAEPDNNRLPTLISSGIFARFALSHEVTASSFSEGVTTIVDNALAKNKWLHPNLTHIGMGFSKNGGYGVLVVDVAKLIPTIDFSKTYELIQRKMDEKRVRNSLSLLGTSEPLNTTARKAALRYINEDISSDEILLSVQTETKRENFTLGRLSISLQAVSDLDQISIPERTADPAIAFAGIGAAQGNRKEHEAGSIVIVLILAEPQTAYDASQKVTALPVPKSAARSKISPNKPLGDQAWTAVLTGNHRKAAELFEKAYKQTKKPALLYEAARAHARNENLSAALKTMKLYAELAPEEDKPKALEMIDKLEKGESIFSSSQAEQMSVEAKRFFLMGRMLFDQQEWDGAVDAFQQAYKYSAMPEIIYNIGLAHYRAGRIGDALTFFGEYQRLVPEAANLEDARQFFEIGVEMYKSGRFETASKQFVMAYSFLPFPELVYNLGLCHKAMGENDKAIRFFREYLGNDLAEKEKKVVYDLIKELSTE